MHPSSPSKIEKAKEFANELDIISYDVNQLNEACNETGAKVNLRFIRVADRLVGVQAHMPTASGNILASNFKGRFLEAEVITVSNLPQHGVENKTYSEEEWEDFEAEFDSDSSSLEKEDTRLRRRKKTKGVGLVKQTEDSNPRFKKRDQNLLA